MADKEEKEESFSTDNEEVDEQDESYGDETTSEEDNDTEIDIDVADHYNVAHNEANVEVFIVPPEKRITPNILSLFEQADLISSRLSQIAEYNNCMVPIDDLTDPEDMAKRELMMGMCPLLLSRPVGVITIGGKEMKCCEEWNPNKMVLSEIYDV